MAEFFINTEPNCDVLRLGTGNVGIFSYNSLFLNESHIFPNVEVWRALGASALYVAERNRPYTRAAYKLIKEVFDENALDNFARNPPFCMDDAFEKKLFTAVRGIINYADPDAALAQIVSFLRAFNASCTAKGSWDSKICEFVFSLTNWSAVCI